MLALKIPFGIDRGGFEREKSGKHSIDSFLDMLISTAKGTFIADPDFGFVLNNLKFENFNEKSGVIDGEINPYNLKISGNSKNSDTFAYELCDEIKRYEKRINSPFVEMSYISKRRLILINITAVLPETKEEYKYSTVIKIWR